jgi:HEAT repeat protein
VALFGPPDVDKLEAKGDMKGLIRALGYQRDEGVRQAAASALGRIGAPVVKPLVAILVASDFGGSDVFAAKALGQIGAPAVEPLIAILPDDHAAIALGEIGDPRAVGPLIALLPARGVARALGEIGDPRAILPLIIALLQSSPGSGWSERGAYAQALRKIDAPAVEPLIDALAALDDHFERWNSRHRPAPHFDVDVDGRIRDGFRDYMAWHESGLVGPLPIDDSYTRDPDTHKNVEDVLKTASDAFGHVEVWDKTASDAFRYIDVKPFVFALLLTPEGALVDRTQATVAWMHYSSAWPPSS